MKKLLFYGIELEPYLTSMLSQAFRIRNLSGICSLQRSWWLLFVHKESRLDHVVFVYLLYHQCLICGSVQDVFSMTERLAIVVNCAIRKSLANGIDFIGISS